ncbi:hypothetical protein CYMTET_23833 [Cymbomonas tetramitiformis]|uniref:Uncharacterized protein n=1 Tax=Cymbomonas tetramitiformis TaxID=36881 RepID=A0AAE0FXE6_9CHLO|nr:hypothetical protein CYMTET_23833 [Cymbomonas tetramitiformis]
MDPAFSPLDPATKEERFASGSNSLPDELLLGFSFDFVAAEFGATQGEHKSPSLDEFRTKIEEGWTAIRYRQLEELQQYRFPPGYDYGCEQAVRSALQKDPEVLNPRPKVPTVRVTGMEKGRKPLSQKALRKLGSAPAGMLLIQASVDLGADPLLRLLRAARVSEAHHEEGMAGASELYRVPLFVYAAEIPGAAASAKADPECPLRWLRAARVTEFNYCLELASEPWLDCPLDLPSMCHLEENEGSVQVHYHKSKKTIAHLQALLTVLFWRVFVHLYKEDLEGGGSKPGNLLALRRVDDRAAGPGTGGSDGGDEALSAEALAASLGGLGGLIRPKTGAHGALMKLLTLLPPEKLNFSFCVLLRHHLRKAPTERGMQPLGSDPLFCRELEEKLLAAAKAIPQEHWPQAWRGGSSQRDGMNGFPSVEGITSAFVDIAASTQGVTAAATNQIISKFHGVVHAQPVLEAVGAGDSRSRGLPLLLPGALPGALPAAVSGPPEQQRRQRTAASTTPAIRCSCSGGEAEWLRHPGSGSKDLWANNAFVVSNLDRLARMTCFTRTWSPEKDASQSAAPPGTGDQEERCMNESQMPVILDVDKCGVVRACNLPLENVWECAAAMEVVQHMTKEYFAQELDRKHGGEFCYAEVEPTDGLIRDELEWLAFGLLKLQHIMLRAQLQGVGLITYERTMPAVHNRFEGMPAQPRTGREAGYMQPRMLLLAAPNNFLARRAEVCELHKLVLPQQDGAFVGGFVPEQFLRGGPLQPYYVQTKVGSPLPRKKKGSPGRGCGRGAACSLHAALALLP